MSKLQILELKAMETNQLVSLTCQESGEIIGGAPGFAGAAQGAFYGGAAGGFGGIASDFAQNKPFNAGAVLPNIAGGVAGAGAGAAAGYLGAPPGVSGVIGAGAGGITSGTLQGIPNTPLYKQTGYGVNYNYR